MIMVLEGKSFSSMGTGALLINCRIIDKMNFCKYNMNKVHKKQAYEYYDCVGTYEEVMVWK